MDTIDRVIKGLKYLQKSDLKSQEGVMKRMNDLIELGARNLTNVISDWVRADSEAIDLADYTPRNAHYPTLSSATHDAIVPIFNYLSTLPRHPRTGYSPLSAGFAAYTSVRSKYLTQCLGPLSAKLQQYALDKIGTGVSGAGWSWSHDDDDETTLLITAGAKQALSSCSKHTTACSTTSIASSRGLSPLLS